MSGLESDEQQELFFLRMEKAAQAGARAAIADHMANVHAPLATEILDAQKDKVSLKTLAWAGATTAGFMGLVQFLRSLGGN